MAEFYNFTEMLRPVHLVAITDGIDDCDGVGSKDGGHLCYKVYSFES